MQVASNCNSVDNGLDPFQDTLFCTLQEFIKSLEPCRGSRIFVTRAGGSGKLSWHGRTVKRRSMGTVLVMGLVSSDQPQDGKWSDLQTNGKRIGWGILGRLIDGVHLAMLRFTGRMFPMRRPASAKPVHRHGSWLQGSFLILRQAAKTGSAAHVAFHRGSPGRDKSVELRRALK